MPSFLQELLCVSRTNRLPFKSQSKQPRSISTTTPVYPIRICIAFCKSKFISARTKLRGKSKEGGRSPLLGRFKGVCKGGDSKLPLCWFPFHRQRPFPLTSKEKGAEYRPFGGIPTMHLKRARRVCVWPFCRKRGVWTSVPVPASEAAQRKSETAFAEYAVRQSAALSGSGT